MIRLRVEGLTCEGCAATSANRSHCRPFLRVLSFVYHSLGGGDPMTTRASRSGVTCSCRAGSERSRAKRRKKESSRAAGAKSSPKDRPCSERILDADECANVGTRPSRATPAADEDHHLHGATRAKLERKGYGRGERQMPAPATSPGYQPEFEPAHCSAGFVFSASAKIARRFKSPFA